MGMIQKYIFLLILEHQIIGFESLEPLMKEVKILENKIPINTANGNILFATKKEKLMLYYQNKKINMEVLLVPNLNHNLLSSKQIN